MRPSILIVDDNVDLTELLEAVLNRNGYDVRVASCGAEGLKYVEQGSSPSLILLDVNMSDMTGPQFLDEIKNRNIELKSPVVYCTAGAGPTDNRVAGCINKMMDLMDFVSAIESEIKTH